VRVNEADALQPLRSVVGDRANMKVASPSAPETRTSVLTAAGTVCVFDP
jgi:hypothetical protein